MIKIGLTGGIGSGKSTVARIFEVLGVPVYYADDAAKRVMNENAEVRQNLIKHFGNESYTAEGLLNRAYISSQVFGNPEKLALLNSISHPATIADSEQWMARQTTPFAIKEAALLFESGSAGSLDYIIGVYSPTPLRILRTMHRDNISREDVLQRMKRQISETVKMKLCDFVVVNDEQELLIPQVVGLREKFEGLIV
ncbi:dephospho-CoA kinase [Terrimonas sp. NA20]|uniref:Dephospho-CoA kinase n=1 Tax=Terrimonas ginsenosidimutans TaxID=2908004 RepID=A0ABS9KXK5_9BACT|nr:dephospho-CoA kinase [Terrimonas ginsenosidimutans]MCG2617114.1 dephospho-CoA kinase [Terrimonas ginsenosidimutans]